MFPHFTFSGTTYQALHRKLTLFCTCVTQIILLALSALCVFVAEKNIKQGNETAFLTETSSVISHLQEQDVISHQWLNQLQENSSIQIYLYENGTPLFYDQYHQTTADEQLCENALLAAEELTGNPPFFTKNKRLSSHTEYQFNSGDNIPYIASVGSIPKGDSYLNFLILRSLAEQSHQMLSLRIIVIIANIAAFLLLFLFFHFFIRKMLEPVETAQKKQTQFIASASHELRTPLAVVRSGLESVEKCSNEEERNHFLHLMSEETVHMKRLIDDMLLLANSDADTLTIKPEACQPDLLLLDTYEKFEPLAKKNGLHLILTLPEEILPDCFCDIHRTEQIFSIIVDNALCYTPSGGKVTLSCHAENEMLCFLFKDTGCGISEEKKSHIFERFYRADDAHTDREHFGLGLCIAKELTEKQNGNIQVVDAPISAAALWYNCHVHFNFYVISTLSCQVIFFLLFHIFQCLIHRNTLDSSEIQYHDKQISDQDKQEHFHIAHRAYAKSVPSTVGKEHDSPDNLHDDDT